MKSQKHCYSPIILQVCDPLFSYSDVRCHRRKELGYSDEVQSKVEADLLLARRSSRSPSVGSVTSGGKRESAWSSSPPYDSADQKSGI